MSPSLRTIKAKSKVKTMIAEESSNNSKAREAYRIERSQTLEPHGLNKKDET